jgi:hypothetical protein
MSAPSLNPVQWLSPAENPQKNLTDAHVFTSGTDGKTPLHLKMDGSSHGVKRQLYDGPVGMVATAALAECRPLSNAAHAHGGRTM